MSLKEETEETVDETPALVFMGSGSKCMFVPEDDDRNASDWEIEL